VVKLVNKSEVSRILRNLRNGIWDENSTNLEGEIADQVMERISNELEDYNIEFKQGIPSNQKLGKLISAISNEGGGTIFLGINDSGEVIGFNKDIRKTSQIIFNINESSCKPTPRILITQFLKSDNKKTLAIIIPPPINELVSYNCVFYKRFGDGTAELTDDEINERSKLYSNIKSLYNFVWEKSPDLIPIDIMGYERGTKKYGFKDYYYQREEDKILQELLFDSKKNILILGPPLSGKSRLIFEAFKNNVRIFDVTVPKFNDINLENLVIPKQYKRSYPKLLLLDDLHRYIEFDNFRFLFKEFLKQDDVRILSTCRSKIEFEKTKNFFLENNLDIENIFEVIEFTSFDEEVAKKITSKLKIPWKNIEFNHTIGSLFYQLAEMKRRYREICNEEEKAILKSVKFSYLLGIFKERMQFQVEWIKSISNSQFEIKKMKFEWDSLFESLENKEFILLVENDRFYVEESYILNIFNLKKSFNLPLIEEISNGLNSYPEAQFHLAANLIHHSDVNYEKRNTLELVIKINKQLFNKKLRKINPLLYYKIASNLGVAFDSLADIVDREKNCKSASFYYNEALVYFTTKNNPKDYAMILLNFGMLHLNLYELDYLEDNLSQSIEFTEKALMIFDKENFPLEYARANNNLCLIYTKYAEINDPNVNFKKAIKYATEAQSIQIIENDPLLLRLIYANKGNALIQLSELERNKNHIFEALRVYKEILDHVEAETFPIQYAQVRIDIGVAYGNLGLYENPIRNLRKSIEENEKALKYLSKTQTPKIYTDTLINLGLDYQRLAKLTDEIIFYKNSISMFKQAISNIDKNHNPIDYAIAVANLGYVYGLFSRKVNFCSKAFSCFKEAFNLITPINYPRYYIGFMQLYNEILSICGKSLT